MQHADNSSGIVVCLALIPIALSLALLGVLVIAIDDDPAASNAEVARAKGASELWGANSKNCAWVAVVLQVLVLPYIFPTPFRIIFESLKAIREKTTAHSATV